MDRGNAKNEKFEMASAYIMRSILDGGMWSKRRSLFV